MKYLHSTISVVLATIFISFLLTSCEFTVEGTPINTEQQPDDPSDTSSEENGSQNGDENEENGENGETPGEDNPETPENPTPENPDTPAVDNTIEVWNGLWADDRSIDVVGSNNDYFHELCSFPNKVVVRFEGDRAIVETYNSSVTPHTSGAYVGLDLTSVSGVEVIVSGKTQNGGLKIYSDNKYKLTLSGVDITSQQGPAINSQSKKRVYIDLADGSTNRLKDCSSYSADNYTLPGSVNEDRKGALFTEGNIILSGYGALVVTGLYKHAIVTDGCYYQRPGATVAVTSSVKNGIHAKGDSDDNTGIYIGGGAITASVSGTAAKGLKCDMDVVIDGGRLNLTTSGDATYDSESQDTSSASGIKSDGKIEIINGSIEIKSSGSGGKGLSSDGDLIVDGGSIKITTTGRQYKYSSQQTSSPKGIRADGNITINGGSIDIAVTGASEGSEGLESKNTLTVNGGETVIKAYDDAINASKSIVINGGKVYAEATNNDGIDSNGTLTLNDGLLIGIGSEQPEGGIDVDNSTSLIINGGYAFGVGGTMMGTPSTSSKQYSVVYGGVNTSVNQAIGVVDASNNMLFSFVSPLTMNNSTIFFSTPDIKSNNTYTIYSGGTIDGYSEYWKGWYYDGLWSGGTTLTTFTPSSVVTQIGNTGGGPGGGGPGGGGPGGGGPGGGWPGGGGGGGRPW